MNSIEQRILKDQNERNRKLLAATPFTGDRITSEIIPFAIDPDLQGKLAAEDAEKLEALELHAARTAIRSLASLAEINELDHLGGALDLIPALVLTLALSDHENITYTSIN